MDIYTATEVAFKNGYERGKADAAHEIINELLNITNLTKNDIIKIANKYEIEIEGINYV